MTQVQDITSPMTRRERKATFSLAGIYALRMLGLFMILPVLSLFTEQLQGSTPFLVGLAISVYGLTQALLQIPFGLLSDRFGRKKIIVIGLVLFASGSIVAAMSKTIVGVLIGRALQGCGAIAAAIMALLADLTQEVHRTKAMAMIGASIGMSFGVAIVAGPIIASFIGVQGIFWLTAVLALLAVLVILFIVPTPLENKIHRDAELVTSEFFHILKDRDLLRLDFGIFILHLMLTAMFVILPMQLRSTGLEPVRHWMVYLPVLVSSMALIIPFVIIAEKKRKMKAVFLTAIATVSVANFSLFYFTDNLVGLVAGMWLFFCGFNLLEATLPSLISKTAPGDLKGTAMGLYSSSQFLGAFSGGAVGGWLYGYAGAAQVFLFCASVACLWLFVAAFMNTPRHLANLLISLENVQVDDSETFTDQLQELPGIETITLHFEESVAYLKVDNNKLNKEQLQMFLTSW